MKKSIREQADNIRNFFDYFRDEASEKTKLFFETTTDDELIVALLWNCTSIFEINKTLEEVLTND